VASEGELFGFDERGTARVVRAVRESEASGPPSRRPGPAQSFRNLQAVRVTGAKDGSYYPGTVTVYNAADEAWEDLGTCWVLEINENDMACDKRYMAFQSGEFENGNDTRSVFVAFSIALRELEVVTDIDTVTCVVTAETILVPSTAAC
jgi:hypothetical protein